MSEAPARGEVRDIELAGFCNLRDAGGYRTTHGRRVRRGVLLRGEYPRSLGVGAREYFAELPLARVVDLRDTPEVRARPRFFRDAGFAVRSVPILEGSAKSFVDGPPTLAGLYERMLEVCGPQLVRAVRAVVQGLRDGAVLVHCLAGKDRTGVVVALIHSLIGVSRADIVADYSASAEHLRGEWALWRLRQLQDDVGPAPQAIADALVESPAGAMVQTLELLDARYGGARAYLHDRGCPDEALQELRDRLVEPDRALTGAEPRASATRPARG